MLNDDDPCPVVEEFIRCTRLRFHNDPLRSLFVDVGYRLDELLYLSKSQPKDKSTQGVRAFYCLYSLFLLLSLKGGKHYLDAKVSMPFNREGINKLIEFCSQARNSEEVKLYMLELTQNPGQLNDMERESSQSLIGLSDIIISAAEYMRPRLRNGQTMAGMGRYLAEGLACLKVPSAKYIEHGTNLVNTTSDN